MWGDAIPGVGRNTLVVKGNVVIDTTTVTGMYGNYTASIRMSADAFATHVKPLIAPAVAALAGVHEFVVFRFSPLSGMFITTNFTDPDGAVQVEQWFEDVRIVDEFNLRYGMVPDVFKTVPGYGAALNEVRAS